MRIHCKEMSINISLQHSACAGEFFFVCKRSFILGKIRENLEKSWTGKTWKSHGKSLIREFVATSHNNYFVWFVGLNVLKLDLPWLVYFIVFCTGTENVLWTACAIKVHIHLRKFSTERKIFRGPHAQYDFF